MTRRRHTRGPWHLALAMLATAALTGCMTGEQMTTPTGDELFAQAREHYFSYRTVTNAVQALIHDGPWGSDGGSYGMEPSGAGCDDGTYKFDLLRDTQIDPATLPEVTDRVRDYLNGQGFTVTGWDLGSGVYATHDLHVRDQGDFDLLMITFFTNGGVIVAAETRCWPGDYIKLGDLMFGDVYLSEGYLPREESPSDPLFFGVTPGDPQFLPRKD